MSMQRVTNLLRKKWQQYRMSGEALLLQNNRAGPLGSLDRRRRIVDTCSGTPQG